MKHSSINDEKEDNGNHGKRAHTIRVDSQRLYRVLVLLSAPVERVLLSETGSIPDTVVKQISKQLGLFPSVFSASAVEARNSPEKP